MAAGLSRYLCESRDTDLEVSRLLDTTEIHLLPSVNPDGYEAERRTNMNDLDLNREFPGWRDLGRSNNELVRGRPKEVKAMMSWIQSHYYFVLSISFHDGQVLINYPWDDSPGAVEGEKSLCSDDDVFKPLACLYSDHHAFMWTG